MQFWLLFKRNNLYIYRNPTVGLAVVGTALFNGLLAAGIFHGLAGNEMKFDPIDPTNSKNRALN